MSSFYAVAFILSALICATIAWASWNRRPAPGALGLAILCLGQFWWSGAFALQWMLTDHTPSMFWFIFRLVGLQVTPTAILVLVLDFTGRTRWLTWRRVAPLLTEPVSMALFAVTDPLHGLYLGGYAPAIKLIHGGALYWVNIAYSYALILFAAGLLIAHLLKRNPYPFQTIAVFVAVMLPVAHFTAQLAGFDLFPRVNSVPFTYTLTGVILWFALTRLGLFKLIPIARDQLIEQLPEGIIVFDASLHIVDINPAAIRIANASGSCIGRTADEAFPERATTISALRAGLLRGDTKTTVRAEFEPGVMVEATASMVLDRDGNRIATLVTLRDITDQAAAAGELEARSEQLAAALERSGRILAAMTDGVLLVDAHCAILHSNAAAARILGSDSTHLDDGLLVEALVPTLPACDIAKNAVSSGFAVTTHVDLTGGRSLTVEVVPLLHAERTGAQTLFILRDETERVAAERMQRDFVANVAHELQTPLTGLSLLADTIPRALRDDPGSVDGFIERLEIEVQRLIHMTARLMAQSKVDEPMRLQAHTSVNLTAVVSGAIAGIDPLAHAKQQSLVSDLADGLEVLGDEPDLGVLVDNLLENAISYTGAGGRIDTTLVREQDADGRSWAVLRVADDGPGIPLEDQQRIFERFYRVDKARSRRTGGAGLGLSIVLQVAEQHGGSVEVMSTPGEGAAFSVRLPLS